MSVKTILYVENDLVSQTLYQKRLECEGFHVECARDGQVAVDILSERVPDLVLLDLMLPKLSGADVLNFMHADPRLTTVPVIIFSNAPMTEVPPDSPMAQSAKRLLKSDCTFPTLLETIQETLAHPPELMVVEAGGIPQNAAANGGSQHNGADTTPKPGVAGQGATTRKHEDFLKEAAAMVPKIREHSMGYIKAPGSEASQTHLSGLHQRLHLLNSSAAQAGCPRVALLTNAFEALLCGIMDKPSLVTPSVLQTVAQAVDCLDTLLKNSDGYSVGPAFHAKVLVVDDDTVCNHVNVSSLKRANFESVGVKDPAAALDLLKADSFDLVVLDINMPGMTGFDVCEKMRRLPNCKKTPVIFVTAFNNFDNRKQSVLSGGNDFVSKPVSPLELALKVTVNLIKARVQGTGAPQPALHDAAGNGSARAPLPAPPPRATRPARTDAPTLEPPRKSTNGSELDSSAAKRTAPLKMARPDSEPQPEEDSKPAPQAKRPEPMTPPANGKASEADIRERLRQSTAALESAKTGLERESVERTRIESQWREQLGAAEALVKQTEEILKEKEARCSRLEKELAGLHQVRDELQNKVAAEQQAAAKAQQDSKELKANLEKMSAERTHLEAELREQLTAARALTAQKETVLKDKEARCGQLEKELAGLQQVRNELETKFASEHQAVTKAQNEIKELQAGLGQQTAERMRLESEWREQLNAVKATAGKTEVALKENEARCGQLDKELAGARQLHHELQNKLAAEQQSAQEIQERLQQSNAELGRAKADIEKQSAERARLETEWRGQMDAAKTALGQKETLLREKEGRCSQLGKELVELQQSRDELQGKLAGEQNTAAKLQQTTKELQDRVQQTGAELERARTALQQESEKRSHWESEYQHLSKSKETLDLELRQLRESQAAYQAGVQEKQRRLADGLRENIQLLQSRLQEAENLNGDSKEGIRGKSSSR